MSVALIGVTPETLTAPAIVTRERLRTNSELQQRITRLGFGRMTKIEEPDDVLVITSNNFGYVVAAGMLVRSRHLMLQPGSHKPEIHVHTGVEEIVRTSDDGLEDISWELDETSVEAATMTLDALRKIAHARDEWNIKPAMVGLPPASAGGPIWAVSRTLSL